MAAPRPSVCITCGLSASTIHPINRMEDGQVCPTCRDRLLDALPPLFPGFGHMLERELAPKTRARKPEALPKQSASSPKKQQRRGPKSGPR